MLSPGKQIPSLTLESITQHCGSAFPVSSGEQRFSGCGPDQTRYVIPDLHAQRWTPTSLTANMSVPSSSPSLVSRCLTEPSSHHEPGPLIDHPDRLGDFEQVYRNGLLEVDDYLKGVTAIPS